MKEVIWIFGLSGAGKTTLGSLIYNAYKEQYPHEEIELLDGDKTRRFIGRKLGYSYEDRCENIRRNAWLAQMLASHDVRVIACFTTPFKENRLFLKKVFKDKIKLVWCRCSVETCIERDTKGLYAEALMGDIRNMIGIDLPFDNPQIVPADYDIAVDTENVDVRDSYTYLAGELKLNIPFL